MSDLRQQRVSAHLDLLRALAALVVFVGHLRGCFFVPWEPAMRASLPTRLAYLTTGFAPEAVIVFFVLSGYLVGGAVIRGQRVGAWRWGPYLLARLTRLWLVLVPALLLGGILDAIGGAARGTVFAADRFTPVAALGNLVFLQGILVPYFGTNTPLWSLSYEFWYYIAFPPLFAALIGRGSRVLNTALVAAVLVFVGREIALRFPIWLMGAAVAALPPFGRRRGRVLALAAAVALGPTLLYVGTTPGVRETWPAETAVGALVAALIAGLQEDQRPAHPGYARVARWVADQSYSLYLLNYPAILLLAGLVVGSREHLWSLTPGTAAKALGLGLLVFAYVVLVARMTEHHTDGVRRALMRRLRRDPTATARG